MTTSNLAEPTYIVAQAAEVAPGGFFSDPFIWMMLIFFAAFYFLVIRPQNKKQKALNELVESLKEGDEVLLSSGVLGKIDQVHGLYLSVKSQGSQFFVQRMAVTQVMPKGTIKGLGVSQAGSKETSGENTKSKETSKAS